MDKLVRQAIVEILNDNALLLRIPIRQRAKFEGWLKFQLAHYLEGRGMVDVEVESKRWLRRDRTDITFFDRGEPYSIELKTAATNWQIEGVVSNNRPITESIRSVVKDAMKLNSPSGIVAFVLFPIPLRDTRWEVYLNRINDETQLQLTKDGHCELVDMLLDDDNACTLVVCAFRSRRFRSWP